MNHWLKRGHSLLLVLLLCLTMALPALAEGDCTHPEEYVEYSTYVKSDAAPEAVDVSYHSTTGDLYETAFCYYCYETVGETLIETNAVSMDNHYLTGGVCEICGYETTCEHPEDMVDVTTFTRYMDYPVKYDDVQHVGSGMLMADYYCMECQCRFDCDTILEEGDEIYEDHYFFTEDGTCALCGCENTCPHTETYTMTDFMGDGSFIAVDEHTHVFEGEAYLETSCSLCEYVVSREPVTDENALAEEHIFDGGVCYACGYQNNCEHPAESVQSWTYVSDSTCEYINEKAHQVTGTLVSSGFCMDCGQSLEEQVVEENFTKAEAHAYYNDPDFCASCGAENPCDHPDGARLCDTYMIEATSTTCDDEKYHTSVGMVCVYEQCSVCGATVSETFEEDQTLREMHSYTDGFCVCGAENTCGHPADRIRESIYCTYEMVKSASAQEHTGEATRHVYNTCTLCYEDVSAAAAVSETMSEPHSYAHGVCWACGQLNECTHPEDQQEAVSYVMGRDYTIVASDASTHTQQGRCYVGVKCGACGEALRGTYVEDGTCTLPHDFLNGICCVCEAVE